MDRISWKQFAVPAAYILLVGVIAIFAHSGLQGDHGLAAFRDASVEERRLQTELSSVEAERSAMENKVRQLSDRYLDLDLLDERARAVLGLVRKEEIIIR